MENSQVKYWFRPKRFWNWFAFYLPVSVGGWIITLILLAALVYIFRQIDADSHSASDSLIRFSPWFISILLIYDLLCFKLGEFPSWWRKAIK